MFFSPLNTYSGYHLTSAYTHLPHFCLTACMVFHSGNVPRLFPHFDEHFALIRNQIFVCICGISKKKTPRSEISGSKDKGAYSFFMYFQILIYTRSTFCILASTIWKHLFPRAGQQHIYSNLCIFVNLMNGKLYLSVILKWSSLILNDIEQQQFHVYKGHLHCFLCLLSIHLLYPFFHGIVVLVFSIKKKHLKLCHICLWYKF